MCIIKIVTGAVEGHRKPGKSSKSVYFHEPLSISEVSLLRSIAQGKGAKKFIYHPHGINGPWATITFDRR